MQSSKFVIKCGNFAVLVDLHILPLGAQDNARWFSTEYRKEVGSLIRDSVEQKVRQFQEARHQKIQPKPKKDVTLNTPLCLEGGNIRLSVYFMKRHINLRCIVRQHYRELRVFPERVVVCASPLENAVLPKESLNQDVLQQSGQSKSKYFSSPGETKDPLSSSTVMKRAVLQKIARQTSTRSRQCRDDQESRSDTVEKGTTKLNRTLPVSSECLFADDLVACAHEDVKTIIQFPELNNKDKEDAQPCPESTGIKRRQRTPNSEEHQKPKRLCLGEVAVPGDSNRPSSGMSSCGSHGAAQPEIRLEEEVLTHGNSTLEQSNQSGSATSLRGSSVKPVSSGSSISSREEWRGGAPRTSRLRRLKKS
ncbi:protein SLX4IP isoform X1 [Triplophysa dalaica]|uniref:protein SLX4IP isoform X1 n=1 Tax=Triplophysa dalaica TaxID=1582913 RepID=UPI0024DF3A94|nr:protein SLX4IP isoform X1 [Triplophysa dalaica]